MKKAVPETNRHDNFPPWVQFNTYYGNQYYLHNTGQNGGTIGADINVESAWAIVRGNPNITVAIIDDGVDTTHEDLQGVLLEGYTAGDSTAKGHSKREYSLGHGTSCAGIVGAVDNEIGIKGVASGVKILPVDILTRANNLQERADAIIWASQRADVLSLSMGNYYSSDTIAAAIEYARVNGRGGKGCVIVCAAGDNNQGSGIVFPANMDNVLAVGAVDKNKNHCSYSPTGFGLNLVAIGGNLDIYTLSNMTRT